jgi:hypothetical protein
MNNSLTSFRESPTASRIRIPTVVILHRTLLSPAQIDAIRKKGSYGPVPKEERIFELAVGGQVLARGKIVRRGGSRFFKLSETPGILLEEETR